MVAKFININLDVGKIYFTYLVKVYGKGAKNLFLSTEPRVWKAEIAAKIAGIPVEVIGDKPTEIPNWLWDPSQKNYQMRIKKIKEI